MLAIAKKIMENFVDALGNGLLARLGERLVALDPESALAGGQGLVVDLGQHQHGQLFERILVIEPQVAVQILAAAQQSVFQVFRFGADLNDTAGAVEIGGPFARNRPDTQRLGADLEAGALDLEQELFLAVGPHAQRRAGDQFQ